MAQVSEHERGVRLKLRYSRVFQLLSENVFFGWTKVWIDRGSNILPPSLVRGVLMYSEMYQMVRGSWLEEVGRCGAAKVCVNRALVLFSVPDPLHSANSINANCAPKTPTMTGAASEVWRR